MSSVLDYSNWMREQSTTETVDSRKATERFEPYENRREKTISTSLFGLADAFVKIDGPISAYAVDRTDGGFIFWIGRINVTLSWSGGHAKLAKLVSIGFLVDAAFHLSGFHHWGLGQPLEYLTWAAMVKRYID